MEQQREASIAAKTPAWAWWTCAGLIALHAVLLAISARVNSITVDEAAHLPAGAAYWRWRELSIYNQTPPLLRILGSWPAIVAGAQVPDAAKFRKFAPQDRFWTYATAFQRANPDGATYHRYFVLGRLALIPVSCLGALLVFLWARELYGYVAGVGACAGYALMPDVLAHGSLVGTDVGTAVAMLATLYAWQRFCMKPTTARAILAGVALGVANLCKLTALLLWPTMAAVLLWAMWFRRTARSRRERVLHSQRLAAPLAKRGTGEIPRSSSSSAPQAGPLNDVREPRFELIAGFVVASLIGWVVLNLGYGYDHTFTPLGRLDLQSTALRRVAATAPWLPAPFPRQYVLGLDAVKWENDQGLPGFLLGESYRGARWGYFPIALAVKLPLGAIALGLLALITAITARHRARRDSPPHDHAGAVSPAAAEAPLLIALVVLAAGITLTSNLNLGVRYLLPVYPLAIVLVSRVCSRDGDGRAPGALPRGYWAQSIAWCCVAVMALESFWIAPRYLTFMNFAAGGPRRGYWIVNDSNLDWGQGLIDLKRWMDANSVRRIGLAYFGSVDPGVYDIDYVSLGELKAGENDHIRFVAVSSYFLAGQRHRMPLPDGASRPMFIPYFGELQKQQPVAVPGNVIFVFRREQVEAAQRSQ